MIRHKGAQSSVRCAMGRSGRSSLDHAKEPMLRFVKGPTKGGAQAATTGGARAVSPVVLQVDGLAKRYGATVALDHVSFALNAGEVCGLLGENGAGKSTLVKALSGVVAPDHGEIRLKGDRFQSDVDR